MKAHLIRATAVTMLLVLLGSVAAQAHERSASTSLTLKANKSTVDQGDEVKFRGKLRSDWKECRKSKSVTLYRDGTAVASTTTSRSGNYSFVMQIDATADWHVSFAGTEWGQHPHSHVCLGSTSPTIRIRVRGGGGVAGEGGVAGAVEGAGTALSGSDVLGAASAVIALLAIGLVALFVSRRPTSVPTP